MSTADAVPPLAAAPGVSTLAAQIVARLPRADRIRLVSGADFWSTEAAESEGVASFMVSDGPHGLRKQDSAADHAGLHDSVPATCFPTASALGSTWNPALAESIGAAIGREARYEELGVVLGPGLNIKRHPAGGRNFEYLSEDPFVSGTMAAAMVRGIQSEGVGACLKHYAVNNQEAYRMRVDALVDERTLREIYLTGFEIAVKGADPWTVMCAYNLVNGEHAGESRRLLTEILRDEWGFDGLVMTDWGATYDRTAGIHAGLDLEMPGSNGWWDADTAAALDSGELAEADLDLACARVITLALKVAALRSEFPPVTDISVVHEENHALARRAAAEAATLLTNDGMLPLAARGTIAVIGAFADVPRYQGGGSSMVKPTRLDTVLSTMRERLGADGEVIYAPGYDPGTGEGTDAQLSEAIEAAQKATAVVLMIGLPASWESEGYDRDHLSIPPSHTRLVQVLTALDIPVAVVLVAGAPVEMPWANAPRALVQAYLGGQAGGGAITDVLFADAEPGGRLAESFPVAVTDLPAHADFGTHPTQVQYREGLYVGYRFHDTFGVPARFAFGHGLSYTTFELGKPRVTGRGTARTLRVRVTNTGDRAGSTVVQVYVHDVESTVYRPVQELRGFAKVHLEPGETTDATVTLDDRSFAVYDASAGAWKVEAGEFELRIGVSSVDIRATKTVRIASDDVVTQAPEPAAAIASIGEFGQMLGRTEPTPDPIFPFHYDSTMGDLRTTWLGALMARPFERNAFLQAQDDVPEDVRTTMAAFMSAMPVRSLAMGSNGKYPKSWLDRRLAVVNAAALRTKRQAR